VKLRPRLIPSVILAATILLGLKVSDIFSVGGHALAQALSPNQATGVPIDLTSEANAAKNLAPPAAKPQDTPATTPVTPVAPAQQTATQAAAPPQQPSGPQAAAAPPADAAKAAPAAEDAKPATQTAEAQTSGAPAPAAPDAKPAIKDPLLLSPAEIEVLQELSVRRAQLDQRSGEIDQQEVVLKAAESALMRRSRSSKRCRRAFSRRSTSRMPPMTRAPRAWSRSTRR